MSKESHRRTASQFEREGRLREAIECHLTLISEVAESDNVDAEAYNHVGDLYARIDEVEEAVRFYDLAVDRYFEDDRHNTAVGVCKKILRIMPTRLSVHRRMGHIRAKQGLLAEADEHYSAFFESGRPLPELNQDRTAAI